MFHVKRTVFSLCMPIKQARENAMGTISENCRALVARQLLQRRMERLRIYLAHFRRCRMREVFFVLLTKIAWATSKQFLLHVAKSGFQYYI